MFGNFTLITTKYQPPLWRLEQAMNREQQQQHNVIIVSLAAHSPYTYPKDTTHAPYSPLTSPTP